MFGFVRRLFRFRATALLVTSAMVLSSLGCAPSDPVDEARALIAQGRFRAAIDLLEPVVREQRENYDAQFHYGRALTLIGEGGIAEWSLRRAMNDPDRWREAGLMIVQNALQANNPQEAVKLLTQMLEKEPDSVPLLLARAEAYANTRMNIDELLDDVDRIREIEPSSYEADRAEIIGYLLAAMTEEATDALDALGERLEAEAEGDTEAIGGWYCTTMALFAKESRDRELALSRFNACADEHPADASVVSAAVDFLVEEKRIERAIEIVERARALQEGDDESGFAGRLADLLLASGRVDEAEALLLEAVRGDDRRTALAYRFRLSHFYDRQGRVGEALEQFEEGVAEMAELEPSSGTMEYTLADLAIRAGRLDRALEVAAELEHPPFRLMVEARVAQERGDHPRAIALYTEAARLWPDNEFARYHAARSQEQLGDFDAAIELYRHATRISAETTNAMSRIALLLYAAGDPVEALNTLNLQTQRAPLDEIGELLRIELLVLLNQIPWIPQYLSAIPDGDPIGFAPRLARVFRGLRLRGEPMAAVDLASGFDPTVFARTGGDRAVEELVRCAGTSPDLLDRVASILDAAAAPGIVAPGLQAGRGLLAEQRGAEANVVEAAFASAIELDPSNPIALLGRARSRASADAEEAVELASRALEAKSVDPQRVTELGLQLAEAGAKRHALDLLERVLLVEPYDGLAAQALAAAALAEGDHSNRTLDLATRAVRFALSEDSVILLRDTYAARGDVARANELTRQLEERRARIEAAAADPPGSR